jgi:HPt (histidine-containing phosphotransfer) domain-containing protein
MTTDGNEPTAAASAPAVDRVALSRLIGSAPATFGALLAVCERDFPSTFGRLNDAIVARDASRSSQAAHAMKGMLLNLCAADASHLAREIERRIGAADYDAALSLLEPLREGLARIRQELLAASEA